MSTSNDAAPIASWYPDPSGDPSVMRWWDGKQWTVNVMPRVNYAAPTMYQPIRKKPTNHILHLLLSVFTFGLWIPVWIIVAIVNA